LRVQSLNVTATQLRSASLL